MTTKNLSLQLVNVQSFAKEPRTKELRRDAVNELVSIMMVPSGLLVRIALLEGEELRDRLANFFLHEDEEENRFLTDITGQACDICSRKTERNVRQIVTGAILKSRHKKADSVRRAVNTIQRAAA